jgi:hypothetical protein
LLQAQQQQQQQQQDVCVGVLNVPHDSIVLSVFLV